MYTPKAIEEQVNSLSRLGQHWWAQLLAAILLFDAYMAVTYKVNILSVSESWLRSRLSFKDALVFGVLLASFFMLLVPIGQNLLKLPSILATERILKTRRRGKAWLSGVKHDEFLSYAILSRNSVAYEEYLRQTTEKKKLRKLGSLYFAFACSLVLNFFSPLAGGSASLSRECLARMLELPAIPRAIGLASVALILLLLALASVVGTRFMDWEYLYVPSEKVLSVVTLSQEEAASADSSKGDIRLEAKSSEPSCAADA